MFGLPGDQDGKPTIDVEEDAETIYTLLVMLYPMEPPTIASYDLAVKLVVACDKYFVNVLRLRAFLYDVLSSPAALEADPMGVYALCWRLGMEDEAKKASRYTHEIDIKDTQVKSNLIQRSGTINSLLALWDLRLRREVALEDLVKIIGADAVGCPSHGDSDRHERWADNWLQAKNNTRVFLCRPFPSFANNEWLFDRSSEPYNSRCSSCLGELSQRGTRAVEALANYPQTITASVLQTLAVRDGH